MSERSCGKSHNFHVYFRCRYCETEKEFYITNRPCQANVKSVTQPGNMEKKDFKCKTCNDLYAYPMLFYCNPGSCDEDSFFDGDITIRVSNIDHKVPHGV